MREGTTFPAGCSLPACHFCLPVLSRLGVFSCPRLHSHSAESFLPKKLDVFRV